MQTLSLIITVLNEEQTIKSFLSSVLAQAERPQEVIIVDGGSQDRTIAEIKEFIVKSKPVFPIHIVTKKGNRAVGRNEAIRRAKGDIILITDAGCVLDKNWVKAIQKPFKDKSADVVAGYYKAKAETVFQKCLTPYVLVMPDKVDPQSFLPATRSMAIRKSVWQEIGRFNETYSHNEDYVFARRLREKGKKIVFAKEAVVFWIPRKSLSEAYVMFYRFAFGDMEAGIVRPKVVVLFFRYILALLLIVLGLIYRDGFSLGLIGVILLFYIYWSVRKNYVYVKDIRAIYYLPLLQFTADYAILQGSLNGFLQRYLPRKHIETV